MKIWRRKVGDQTMPLRSEKNTALNNADDDIKTYFNFNIKMLLGMSVFVNLNDKKNPNKYGIFTKVPILTIITVAISLMVALQQFVRTFLSDIQMASTLLSNVLSNISCCGKGLCLALAVRDLQSILHGISIMWNCHRPEGECRERIIKSAKKTLTFVKGYIWMSVMLIGNICIPPLQYMVLQYITYDSSNTTMDYSIRLFPIKYPFSVNTGFVYCSVLFHEFWILFGLTLCWVSCDTLFASLTTHLAIQFEVLKNDINNLINNENDELRLKKNLFIFVDRHREISRMSREIERIFSPVLFLTVAVASMNICVNTYMVQQHVSAGRYSGAGFHFSLALNTFLQILVYCVYGESITQSHLSISDAIYNCEWSDKNQDFKVGVQILLMKTQKPSYYKAYGLFDLSHEQLTKIINAAVSYYMMLQTTKQQ